MLNRHAALSALVCGNCQSSVYPILVLLACVGLGGGLFFFFCLCWLLWI